MKRTRTVRSARWGAVAGTAALGMVVVGAGTAAATARPLAPTCLVCLPTAPVAGTTQSPASSSGGLLGTVGGVVGSTLTAAGSAVAGTVTGAGGILGGALSGSTAPGPLGSVTGPLGGAVTGITGTLGDTVTGVTDTLSSSVGGLTGSAGGALTGIPGKVPSHGGQPAATTPDQQKPATGTLPGSGTVADRRPDDASRVAAAALGDALRPRDLRGLDLGASAQGVSSPSQPGGSPTFTHLDISTQPVSAGAAIAAITLICGVGAGNLLAVRRLAVARASQAAHSST